MAEYPTITSLLYFIAGGGEALMKIGWAGRGAGGI